MDAVETLVEEIWTGKTHHIYTYRFVNQVPIRDGEDALEVNWCELTITSAGGKQLYKNAFATDFKLQAGTFLFTPQNFDPTCIDRAS